MRADRQLILEDGSTFPGMGFGSRKDAVCEIVFNTSCTGYQEILSDPSYTNQAVVMTYPLIGNYGLADEDYESRLIAPGAMIVRDLCENPFNFRSTRSMRDLFEEKGIPGLFGVDTRRLTRNIRDYGSQRGLITDISVSAKEGVRRILDTPVRHDAVAVCSCQRKWYSRTSNPRFHVVAVDCGMKLNIVRMLNRNKCNVSIVPYHTGSEEILAMKPDGVFISNGPGDPEDVPEVAKMLKGLRGKIPLFGICLGHQLIALSYGAKTYRLKFGHRGGNHPVKELSTGRIEITSQNHGYAVDEASLEGSGLKVTHVNLLDGTVEGLACEEDKVFCVQYHPESAPGPQDSMHLFERFTDLMGGAEYR
jgi:carbamoyl-phosphate synthase small subunit